MQEIENYLEANRDKFQEELFELLRIPSVSADSAFKNDVQKAGHWVAEQFKSLGFETEVIPTAGHPIIYAQSPPVENAPTALVYGHYDVQPPDPLDEWITPPFEPTLRDGNIYARGATDDKGQMFTHLKSAEAWIRTVGKLPLQLKFLIEGEEEIGSHNLESYLNEHADRLACDCVVISDTSQFGPGQPAITYGLRGIAYYEIRLTGPKQDLHSGVYGGSVTNPAIALAKILASLVDEDGRITLPEFYENVVSLKDAEREQFQYLPFDEQKFMRQLDVEGLSGESGYSTLERRWARPSYDVNGLWSGYQGEGAKTVLPAKAGAKLSFRLVPDQKPEKISAALKEHVESRLPPGIELEFIDFQGAPGFVVSLDSPYVKAASQAIAEGFGRSPVLIREGGSIPIVTSFSNKLEADTLLLGWGLDDDNMHSPNEKFCLADFHRGIKASAHLWQQIADCAAEQA